MASLHAEYLKEEEARKLAVPLLRKHFGVYGFTDASVKEEEDFDGTYVFRIEAHVTSRVPAKLIIDATQDIRKTFKSKGEERFVYLSTHRPSVDEPDEDQE